MSSSSARSAVNTLSASRTRVIPKTIDFGSLTLNLERASARAARSSDPTLKRQFESNGTSSLLDRLASRPAQKSSADARPLQSNRPRRGPGNAPSQVPKLDESSSSKINASRARFNRIPDPTRLDSPRRAAPEYVREVSSLDRLAAESGVDGSVAAIRARRSYKDRISARPPTSASAPTRFALPKRPMGAGSRSRKPSSQRTPGQSTERRQTKAQEEESSRLAAIQARASATREQPVPYAYSGLSLDQFSPVLQKVYASGSRTFYREFKNLEEDSRDAVRLVVGNRSIVSKQTVLKKIETWIPETSETNKASEVRA